MAASHNPLVVGSSPTRPTKYSSTCDNIKSAFFFLGKARVTLVLKLAGFYEILQVVEIGINIISVTRRRFRNF